MQFLFNLLFLLIVFINTSYGQKYTEVDEKINENKGTLVIREIKKVDTLQQSESLLILRVFQPFYKLQTGGTHSVITISLNNSIYTLQENGILRIKTIKGKHKFSVTSSFEPLLSSFRHRILKIKNKRSYTIDIYLPTSFIPYRH